MVNFCPHIFVLGIIILPEKASCMRINVHVDILLSLGVILVEGRHFVTVINVSFNF